MHQAHFGFFGSGFFLVKDTVVPPKLVYGAVLDKCLFYANLHFPHANNFVAMLKLQVRVPTRKHGTQGRR